MPHPRCLDQAYDCLHMSWTYRVHEAAKTPDIEKAFLNIEILY